LEHVATSENAWGGGQKFFGVKNIFLLNDVKKYKKCKKKMNIMYYNLINIIHE